MLLFSMVSKRGVRPGRRQAVTVQKETHYLVSTTWGLQGKGKDRKRARGFTHDEDLVPYSPLPNSGSHPALVSDQGQEEPLLPLLRALNG